MQRRVSVGVIGAGIAGLACARRLVDAGHDVTVLEKSRGAGGRMATRREAAGTFDHGAQYFTVREPSFAVQVKSWCDAGTASAWNGRLVSLNDGNTNELAEPRARYVGVPTMNAIAKSLAADIKVVAEVTVSEVVRAVGQWRVFDRGDVMHGPFDWLISTAPPPQTYSLLNALPTAMVEQLRLVTMRPCWAVLVQFPERVAVDFDGAFVHDSPLAWIARDSSKPGRPPGERWVLHAGPDWSTQHLEDDPQAVLSMLLASYWKSLGQRAQEIVCAKAHRWRYALPERPLEHRSLLDADLRLGVCGDWCGGPRVEGAYLSGNDLAQAVLASL